jgi:pimeloyl-ACP methyl ester carboxylesterase
MIFPVTDNIVRTARHTSFYLACGPADGTPIILLHGWPELSISWRHQLACFAQLGFRAIAPVQRGGPGAASSGSRRLTSRSELRQRRTRGAARHDQRSAPPRWWGSRPGCTRRWRNPPVARSSWSRA